MTPAPDTNSLILSQDARSEKKITEDNPVTEEQLNQTTAEIENDTPDTSEIGSLQSVCLN